MWLSSDGRSENRTKIQILGFHFGATNQQAVLSKAFKPVADWLFP
jgi:hypothetical protein